MTTITAIFDGKVLQPEKPLDLKPNQRYIITINNDELSAIEDQTNSLPEQNRVRNHKSFLNGYSPEDEGLYDDY